MSKVYEGISPDAKGLHYILKTGVRGNVFGRHPRRKAKEAIRYASNQTSIFISDQLGPCTLPAVVMENGFLTVDDSNEALNQFLELSPQNGVDFRLVDKERDAQEELENDELILDVRSAIRSKSSEENGAVALASLLSMHSKAFSKAQIDEMGPSQVRAKLYALAKKDPSIFTDKKGKVNCFSSNDFIRQDIVLRALSQVVIELDVTGRQYTWANGEDLLDVPYGKDATSYLADYFLSSEGKKVMQSIAKELADLDK